MVKIFHKESFALHLPCDLDWRDICDSVLVAHKTPSQPIEIWRRIRPGNVYWCQFDRHLKGSFGKYLKTLTCRGSVG